LKRRKTEFLLERKSVRAFIAFYRALAIFSKGKFKESDAIGIMLVQSQKDFTKQQFGRLFRDTQEASKAIRRNQEAN